MSTREQVLALGLTTLILGAGLWYLLIAPLRDQVQTLRDRVASGQRDLTEMRAIASEIGPSPQHANASAAGDRSTPAYLLVDRLLNQAELDVSRISPDGNDALRLQFAEVRFDSLIEVLEQLKQREGLRTDSATLERRENGQISARLEMERQ